MQNTAARPTGVTILAVLGLVGGVLGILGGLLVMLSGTVLGAGAFIYGLLLLILAVGELAFGYGAWSLQPWAWTVGIAVAAGSVLVAIVAVILGWNSIGGVIISIVISGVILYYLTTPPVKAAFGKA